MHPVSTSRCYNKLPVVLRLPQHLAAGTTLNFSASHTYFLDPDSRLLSPIASEVPCSALFPAVYQTHQGWIAVTPDIHQAPSPQPLPVQPPRRTEGVFREPDYNEGGLYQSDTLDAMQDFLLTPLLREAVTYKLAHQVHNLRPENEYILGPLDVFPVDAAAAADWRNLLFGGWWSWLEKWGKVASVCIGAYYLYVAARWVITTLFSPKGTVRGTWVWTQPFVGVRTRTGCLPHAVLPPVETLQTTSFTNRERRNATNPASSTTS